MLTILNPVALPRDSSGATMPLIDDLAGKTIGILSNHWKSMDRMAGRMQMQLKETYRVADVLSFSDEDLPFLVGSAPALHVALHACGGLHRRMVRGAVAARAAAFSAA